MSSGTIDYDLYFKIFISIQKMGRVIQKEGEKEHATHRRQLLKDGKENEYR